MDSTPTFLLQKASKLVHNISIGSNRKGSFRLCILLPDWLPLAAKVCRLLRSAQNASTQAQKVLFPWTFACTSLLGQGNNATSKCFRQPHGGAITGIFLLCLRDSKQHALPWRRHVLGRALLLVCIMK